MVEPIRVGFVLPHLSAGGIENVVLNLLLHLDRGRFAPGLLLFRRHGDLLARVPGDVPVRDLGGRAARGLPWALAAALGAWRPDVVYAGTNAANLAVLTATLLMRRPPPVIISEHTPPHRYLAEAKLPRLRGSLMRWLYPRAAALAVPVAEIGTELHRLLGISRPAVVDLPNPLSLPARRAAPSVSATAPAFLSVGRLVPAKGFDLLIEAFAALRVEFPAATLVICGEGEARGELERLCRRLGVADAVSLPGFVADPLATFGAGRILVMASRREGFGNVLVEALAAGVPVVAADCPVGPRFILDGGRYGLLVTPENPAALADGMRRLLRDPALAEELRRSGPGRAAAFDLRKSLDRFGELFEWAAGRRPSPSRPEAS